LKTGGLTGGTFGGTLPPYRRHLVRFVRLSFFLGEGRNAKTINDLQQFAGLAQLVEQRFCKSLSQFLTKAGKAQTLNHIADVLLCLASGAGGTFGGTLPPYFLPSPAREGGR
jgi:hypothetical protein